MLRALGIQTCSDLYHKRGLLYHLVSETAFQHYMQITAGIGKLLFYHTSTGLLVTHYMYLKVFLMESSSELGETALLWNHLTDLLLYLRKPSSKEDITQMSLIMRSLKLGLWTGKAS